jgi:HEXXH motif-containing protein
MAIQSISQEPDELQTAASAFATPFKPMTRELFDAATGGWAAIVLRQYLEKNAGTVPQDTQSFLLAAANVGVPGRAAVDPAFGAVAEALSGGASAAAVAAVCLVLDEDRGKGEWSVGMRERRRLRAGDQILPVCHTLRSGQALPPRSVVFERLQGEDILCWNSDIAGAEDLRVVPRPLRRQLLGAPPARLRAAFDLMRRHAPRYARWVQRITRVVLLQTSARGLMESGSYPTRVGMIRVSADARPAAVAEMLVHEACHQYFYVLRRLGPFFEKGADSTYYSPLKQRNRPLEKLLLGFHAFGNVLLMHRQLNARGALAGFTPEMIDVTESETRTMWRTLSEHAIFSSLGRALFLPLQDRLGW